MKSNPIYKLDSAGRLRSWQYQVDETTGSWRTQAGLVDGQKVTSGWTTCTPKSQPTAAEQALFEAKAAEQHKLTREYHPTRETVATPNFFKPMLAHSYGKFGGGTFPMYSQPKLDGIRCIATIEGLFSRQGKPILSCPHIIDALAPVFAFDPDIVLDGELYNHDLKADFERVVSLVRKAYPTPQTAAVIQYHVYDLPSQEGGFHARIGALQGLVEGMAIHGIVLVPTRLAYDQESLDADYAEFLAAGYEGQMLRQPGTSYEQKRSNSLLKRKEFEDAEFEIVAIEEGLGNWSGYAKRVTLRNAAGATFGSGLRGSQDFAKQLLAEREAWVGRQATCRYQNLTSDGIPRFPVVVAFHEGDRL